MLSIQLNNLTFFAFHGLYEEEKLIGGEFEVNISIDYMPQTPVITSITETIDYSAVYTLVKEYMSIPTPLLETLAMNIAHGVLQKFSLAERIEIFIKKVQPPFPNFEGNVQVMYRTERT